MDITNYKQLLMAMFLFFLKNVYIIVYLYIINLHFQESNTCNESIIFYISAPKSFCWALILLLFLVCVPIARHTD